MSNSTFTHKLDTVMAYIAGITLLLLFLFAAFNEDDDHIFIGNESTIITPHGEAITTVTPKEEDCIELTGLY